MEEYGEGGMQNLIDLHILEYFSIYIKTLFSKIVDNSALSGKKMRSHLLSKKEKACTYVIK